jgi:YidC/Oxa1 family membrane protein insertase
MDTKRLILAFVLIMGFLWLYNTVIMPPRPQVVPTPTVQATPAQSASPVVPMDEKTVQSLFKADEKSTDATQAAPSEVEATVLEAVAAAAQTDQIVVETGLYRARFSNKGAALVSFELKGYTDDLSFQDRQIAKNEKPPLDLIRRSADQNGLYPFLLSPFEGDALHKELNQALFTFGNEEKIRVDADSRTLSFRYADPVRSLSIEKRFTFYPDSYRVGVEIKLMQNGKERSAPIIFGPDLENRIVEEDRGAQAKLKISAHTGTDLVSQLIKDVKTLPQPDSPVQTAVGAVNGQFYWSAFHSTYFAAVIRTDPRFSQVRYAVLRQTIKEEKDGKIGERLEQSAYMIVDHCDAVFLGPKDERILEREEGLFPSLHEIIEYGWFGIIAKWMLKGIQFIHHYVPNYGWAIILFTVLLKLVLFPLTYTSSVSMAKMSELQPKIKALKKKYKNMKDPEQRRNLNIETMELYKREKVNPAGGCLPLLIQMPILFGFFQLLSVSISVRHEPWAFWIGDLSIKDPYYILPILFGVTQIVITRMTPSSGDAMNKKIMYLMPVFFTFIVLNLPSGLTLYWFVSNLLQMGQQHIINQKVHAARKEELTERKKA